MLKLFREKHTYVFDADKAYVIEKLMEGVNKADFSQYVKIFEKDTIYGKTHGNTIVLYHGTPFRNSFRPVFSAKIEEGTPTTLVGSWRLPGHLNLFLVAWYLFLLFMIILIILAHGGEGTVQNLQVFYVSLSIQALFPALLMYVCLRLESKRMQKVLDYIAQVKKQICESRHDG